jgi:hypothetical protein
MKRIVTTAALLLLAGVARAQEVSDRLIEEEIAINEGVAAALKPVVDEKTAKAALPALQALAKRQGMLDAQRAVIGPVPPQVAEALAKKYGQKRDAARKAVQSEIVRVAKLPGVYALYADLCFFKATEAERMEVARLRVKTLTLCLDLYKVKNGDYPKSLEQLAREQPDGGSPLLPPEGLTDPWGGRFHYDPAGPKNMGLRADVWAVPPGKAEPIGNWQKPR